MSGYYLSEERKHKEIKKAMIYSLLFILAYTFFDKLTYTIFRWDEVPTFYHPTIYHLIIFLILPITAILLFQDVGSIVFFYTSILWYLGGLEDILFYVLFLQPIPNQLPWLYNGFAGFTAKYLLNLETVTPYALISNVILFSIPILPLSFLFKEK